MHNIDHSQIMESGALPSSPPADFVRQVQELYQHLSDLVYLRSHPLLDVLIPDPSLLRKDKAWQLQDLLLAVIKELDPGPAAQVFSREWRRYRLMLRRYKNGIDPQIIMQEIAISRRQYYREQEAAITAVAGILWDRCSTFLPADPAEKPAHDEPSTVSRLEILRMEAARLAQADRFTDAGEVIEATLSLLDERLRQRSITVNLTLSEPLPSISIDKGVLRQMLLGMAGYLIERANQASLRITAREVVGQVHTMLTIEPPEALRATGPDEIRERIAAFTEMAALGDARIEPVLDGVRLVGFNIMLHGATQHAVLVVDDNDDVLELYHRYLVPHGYHVLTARSVPEALELAERIHPYAITVDLMLPGQDGWDLIQTLLNRSDTRQIPIIVCSVLKQKELALSLGATAFLEKPVTEEMLLSSLSALSGS